MTRTVPVANELGSDVANQTVFDERSDGRMNRLSIEDRRRAGPDSESLQEQGDRIIFRIAFKNQTDDGSWGVHSLGFHS